MKKLYTLVAVAMLAVGVNAQNLLQNPGFENGLESWSSGPTSSYTAPEVVTGGAQAGDSYVAYDAIAATTGFFQAIPVTGGETYEINFWYKATGDESDARLWSFYKDAADVTVYTTEDAATDEFRTLNGYLPVATEWTYYTAKMPAAASAVALQVAVRGYTGGTIAFDSFAAGKEGTMNVADVNDFANSVQMNTVVTDKLVLKLAEKSTVNIYTIDGKLVSSNRVDNNGSVNTQSLVKGIYVVTVSNGKSTISQKIVKK